MKEIELKQVPLLLSLFKPTLREYSKALELYHDEVLSGQKSDHPHKQLDDYLSFAGRYVSNGNNLFFSKMSEKYYDSLCLNSKIYSEIEAVIMMPQKFSELEKCNGGFFRQIKVCNTGGILKFDDKIVKSERRGALVYEKQNFWKNFGKILESPSEKELDKMGNPFELRGYKISNESYPSTLRILTSEHY